MRLDLYLVEHQYYQTRTKAQEAIRAAIVSVDGKIVTKPNYIVSESCVIQIQGEVHPFVSRGGVKLSAAIQAFHLDFQDKIVLDIGSSTGGFTDCALQMGAKLVYAVDVGSQQLDERLRQKSEVVVMEQTNILEVYSLPTPIDYIVMDVSFVSIEKLLPAIDRFLTLDNVWVCLIKPQFEAGKQYFKNGVIKDRSVHLKVLKQLDQTLKTYGMGILKLIPSPILGGSGNKEFLAYIKRNVTTQINFLEVCR